MSPEPVDPFRLLLEGIADYALFLLDTEGRVTRWSSSAQKVFGYTTDEIQGLHFSCLYLTEEADPDIANDELKMAAAHGRFEDIGWRIRRDKSQFWADSVICPMRDDNGQINGFSQIIRDITERKKAEENLRQKEEELSQARKMEAMGRLAGGIAHDFNNFITGIVGLADEIRLSMTEHDPRREDLEEIIKTADQARLLTRELLAFGRRQVSTPQVLNLNSVLKEKQKMFARLLGADIQLKMELDSQIRNILIDPTQFDQMLINLIMNARDAMPKGGSIRMETHRTSGPPPKGGAPDPQVLLVVSDTGYGMEEETLARIFEPFFTTKAQGKGTGLGLATVYGIVKQNHGEISVKSQPGKGTTFQIQFPEIDAPVHVQQAAAPAHPANTVGSETILVVEDTDVVRRIVTQALDKSGYHVLAASSGTEALELAKQYSETIHLILTDMIMPGISGREVAERLPAMHPETAILYMSAYAEDMVQERGLLGDNAAFIEKPFTSASLLHKVREILDSRHTSTYTQVP